MSSPNPTYSSWSKAKSRCENPNDPKYSSYGGRGITVCDRWRNSFKNFLADMGLKPSSKHSIDRIDNDGNYEPGNCRWATATEQSRNRRSNRPLTLNGRTQLLIEWAEEIGIYYLTISRRIDVLGWSVERALTTPVDATKRNSRSRVKC